MPSAVATSTPAVFFLDLTETYAVWRPGASTAPPSRAVVPDDELEPGDRIVGSWAGKGIALRRWSRESAAGRHKAFHETSRTTNVWHGRPTEEGIAGFTKAVFCLNPALRWETNLDGDDRTYDIGRVATHEIGHAIGLDHPGPSGQLMGYRYTEVLEGLEAGDIDGARRLYGNPRLPRSE